jgi:hypothetical protein
MQAGARTQGSQVDPSIRRRNAQARYLDLINDPGATVTDLREALAESASMLEGAEARVALLGAELVSVREAVRERRRRTAPGGRVGQARVYTQAEIEAVQDHKREAEATRAQAKAARASRGRGQGRGTSRARSRGQARGRSRGRGRGQQSSQNIEASDTSSLGVCKFVYNA